MSKCLQAGCIMVEIAAARRSHSTLASIDHQGNNIAVACATQFTAHSSRAPRAQVRDLFVAASVYAGCAENFKTDVGLGQIGLSSAPERIGA